MHIVNITIHVLAGSTALLFGITALFTKKGGYLHKKAGNIFLILLFLVVLTGLIGVFVFKRNGFLLIITLLSAYQGFSGYRVLQVKNNRVKLTDVIASLVTLGTAFYFICFLKETGFYWSLVVVYSTIATLFLVIGYDFIRYLIPQEKYKSIWLLEHIYKMTGAFTALLSAFAGTVFPDYKPYSQILPSLLGLLVALWFIWKYYNLLYKSK
jgi:uncharacterized membrane protein